MSCDLHCHGGGGTCLRAVSHGGDVEPQPAVMGGGYYGGLLCGLQGPKWKERDSNSATLMPLSSMIVISNWLTVFVVGRQTVGVCRLTAAVLPPHLLELCV